VPSVATEPVLRAEPLKPASAKACGLSTPEQALVSLKISELGDHGVEAGGRLLRHSCGNGLRCLVVIGHFHKSKNESAACLAICHDVNASNLTKGWKSAPIGLVI